MKLTTKLAVRHLMGNRRQSAFTIAAAGISTAMLCGVSGIAYSFYRALLIYAETTFAWTADSVNGVLNVISGVVPFLSAIICFGAVIIISNAFSISVGEQVRQFGILKSVGATTKQIRAAVLSEGGLLSLISIPVGVALGYAVTAVSVLILNYYLGGSEIIAVHGEVADITFYPVFHLRTLLASCALSFVTIMLSVLRVALKVSGISAIDAIKQTGETIIEPGRVKTSALTQKIFGFEGTLAAKSLKRAKRKYRVTVASLVTSIALTLISASFGQMLYSTADAIRPEFPGNVRVMIIHEDFDKAEQLLRDYGGDIQIAPEYYDGYVHFYCQVENADGFAQYAEGKLSGTFAERSHIDIANLEQRQRQIHQIYTMLMVFIYGFIGMLASIGVTGVIAAINSNIALRTSEFAVLRAVGMDAGGMRRMLNLESLLYGLKSLLIGLPLGLVLSYAMYCAFTQNIRFDFSIPWLAVLLCAVGVFAVTFISMRYAAGRLRSGNIAEGMRTLTSM